MAPAYEKRPCAVCSKEEPQRLQPRDTRPIFCAWLSETGDMTFRSRHIAFATFMKPEAPVIAKGMMTLRDALASAAQKWEPEAWGGARDEERSYLLGKAAPYSFIAHRWTSEGSIAGRTYPALRVYLENGFLPAYLRTLVGAPKVIEPSAWLARGPDRLELLLRGVIDFVVAGGATERGEVLIRSADLDVVLSGGSAKIAAPDHMSSPENIQVASKPLSARGGGRPPNVGVDQFWLEICRVMHCDGLPKPPSIFAAQMAQWASDNMAHPYDAETVRKKVSKLYHVINWD